jgi:hypothetical protein
MSGIDTGFYVDHGELLETLARVREPMDRPLGVLLDDHEFALNTEARRRPRSKVLFRAPSGSVRSCLAVQRCIFPIYKRSWESQSGA